MSIIDTDRIATIADNFITTIRTSFDGLKSFADAMKALKETDVANDLATQAIATRVSDGLRAWKPQLPDLTRLCASYIRRDYDAATVEILKLRSMIDVPGFSFSVSDKPFAEFAAGREPATDDEIACMRWASFVEEQLEIAAKNEQVDAATKRPWFQAQVTLRHRDLGVGTVQWNEDTVHRLLELRAVNQNPANPKQSIATVTYFAIEDVTAMTLLAAVAEDKPRSSIIV